MHTVLSQIE
jgi:hypothetical protein